MDSQADPKKVYSIFSLPPIKDNNIYNFQTFDIILLNYKVNIPEAPLYSNILRYEFHRKDYLNDNKKTGTLKK